jgi:hypothetical protein
MAMISNALIPIFAGLLNYRACICRAMDNQDVQTLNAFITSFAMPCSIFLAVANTPIRELREQAAPALVLSKLRRGRAAVAVARVGRRAALRCHRRDLYRDRLPNHFIDSELARRRGTDLSSVR